MYMLQLHLTPLEDELFTFELGNVTDGVFCLLGLLGIAIVTRSNNFIMLFIDVSHIGSIFC